MSKESRRYAYNPDVFEVGRKQAAQLVYGDGSVYRFDPERPYIVAYGCSMFNGGSMFSSGTFHVGYAMCFENLSDAEDYVQESWENDLYDFGIFKGHNTAFDYEIWHLVDDGELWDEWESRVADSRRSHRLVVAHLHDCVCTAQRQFVLADGFAMAGMPDMDYRIHDVDWSRMPSEGVVYELQTFFGACIDVFRFPSKEDYERYMSLMDCVLQKYPYFSDCYGYDADGLAWREELVRYYPDVDFREV